jgi:glycosyltransferase involved in cell wall biosynthesis
MLLSIVTPAFNEAANLPVLYGRIVQAMDTVAVSWEWVIVDDHSRDDTFAVIERLAATDPRIRGIRLARNSGSHAAIGCALHHVRGDAAVMIVADLQDPPEAVGAMLERWRRGVQVVWAVRRAQPGPARHAIFSSLYYRIMRNVVGMKEMPSRGTDFFLIDRAVIEAFRQLRERNTSVLALIMWLGFSQEYLEYDKRPRAMGAPGWTFAKKLKLVIDSVTSFSDAPIRLCSYAGLALIAVAIIVAVVGMTQLPTLGAGLLLVVALVVGLSGVQLLALGILGEYVWRALDEARGRPAWIIERETVAAGVQDPVGALTAAYSAEKQLK